KRGKCPAAGPYLPEKAQVAVQALLLREHGYKCDRGEIYFAKDRRRVPVELDDRLIDTTRYAIRRAREVVEAGKCPPPLEDNPKCHGCSLAGICLPDEVTALDRLTDDDAEEDADVRALSVGDDPWDLAGPEPDPIFDTPVHRLFPDRDERVPLYVQGQGAAVRISGDRLVGSQLKQNATEARVSNTSSVTLYGIVQITRQAMRRRMDEGIPLLFASSGGWFTGRAVGTDTRNVELRAAQYAATSDPARCVAVAQRIVQAKVKNSRTILRRNHKKVAVVALGELKQLAVK